MFTLGILYLYIYIVSIFCIFCISFTFFPLNILTQFSLPSFLFFLNKYTKVKEIFYFLVFILTGLPPFGLFFVKFNILSFLLYQTSFFCLIIIFFLYFLNMLYYSQIFNLKNYKKKSLLIIDNNFFATWDKNFNAEFYLDTYKNYQLVVKIITVCLLFSISIILYTDVYFLI